MTIFTPNFHRCLGWTVPLGRTVAGVVSKAGCRSKDGRRSGVRRPKVVQEARGRLNPAGLEALRAQSGRLDLSWDQKLKAFQWKKSSVSAAFWNRKRLATQHEGMVWSAEVESVES